MKGIIGISITALVMGTAMAMLDKLLPEGKMQNSARACLGFVYLAAIVNNLAVLFLEWGV